MQKSTKDGSGMSTLARVQTIMEMRLYFVLYLERCLFLPIVEYPISASPVKRFLVSVSISFSEAVVYSSNTRFK